MKIKNLGKKLSVIAAICMILIGGVTPALAVNWTDSSFQYDFGKLNQPEYTKGRAKHDTSKSYMHAQTITSGYTYKAKVYASLGGGNYVDCSNGTTYTFGKGTKHYMTNLVRERGYTAAAIQARAGFNVKNVTATGVWSPDNVSGIGL